MPSYQAQTLIFIPGHNLVWRTPVMSLNCPVGEKPCHNGAYVRCEPRHEICSGRVNCINAGDFCNGLIRPPCMREEFKCNDGFCIPANERCNGRKACLDNSDEWNCESPSGPPVTVILIISLLVLWVIIIIPVIIYTVRKCRQKKRARQPNQPIQNSHPGPIPMGLMSQIHEGHDFQLTQQCVGEIGSGFTSQAQPSGYTTFLGTDPPRYTEVVETVPVQAQVGRSPKPPERAPDLTTPPPADKSNNASCQRDNTSKSPDRVEDNTRHITNKDLRSIQQSSPQDSTETHCNSVQTSHDSPIPEPNGQIKETLPNEHINESAYNKREKDETGLALCESNGSIRDDDVIPSEISVPFRDHSKTVPQSQNAKTTNCSKDHIYENIAFVNDLATVEDKSYPFQNEGNNNIPRDSDQNDAIANHYEDKPELPPRIKNEVSKNSRLVDSDEAENQSLMITQSVASEVNHESAIMIDNVTTTTPISPKPDTNNVIAEVDKQNIPGVYSKPKIAKKSNASEKDTKRTKHVRRKTIDILKSADSLLNIANINNAVREDTDMVNRGFEFDNNDNTVNDQSILRQNPEWFKGHKGSDRSDAIKCDRKRGEMQNRDDSAAMGGDRNLKQIDPKKDHADDRFVETADTLIEQLVDNIQNSGHIGYFDKRRSIENLSYESKVNSKTGPREIETTRRNFYNRANDFTTTQIHRHIWDGSLSNGTSYRDISVPIYGIHRAKSLNSIVVPLTTYHQNISEYPSVDNMHRGHSVNDLHLTWAVNRDTSDV
ncbi:unnamed protein product [Owenia fusiformis]|uniref:Uncharacterized protein n=1 Tax=Owenia fusiformis TaxID=6347 RepID=A0A8S4Q3C6_OWEFU|nr:unnamed protein product [Owenia fusiformis]